MTSAETSTVDPKAAAHAADFRAALGFQADAAYVTSSYSSPSAFPNNRWGIPLTNAEALELTRREAIMDLMPSANEYAQKQPDYAGEFFDHLAGGIPVYLFTKDLEAHRIVLAGLFPPGTPFEVRPANVEYSVLAGTQASVDAASPSLRKTGIQIVSTGIDPTTNSVLVGVTGLTRDKAATLEDRFGSNLTFREQGPAVADACNSMADCWPPKGGLEIASAYDGGLCTSGFIASRLDTQALVMVTAGHCLEVHGGTSTVWTHHGNNIGQRQNETWNPNSNADVGLIGIYTASTPTTKNQAIVGMPATVAGITIGTSSSNQSPGNTVCRTGRTTGLSCGTIYLANVTRQSCVNTTCYSINHTWEVTFDSTGGDSGGPLIHNQTFAHGTHVHSDPDGQPNAHGWYSPTDWGRSAYSAMFGVSYVICVQASC